MDRNIEALKKVFVALGYGSSVNQYNGNTMVDVLKEGAVKMGLATSVSEIKATTTSDALNFIADNYGTEENEPFDLEFTESNATITVTRNDVELDEGTDILWTGDILTISATADEGYEISSLTVNGDDFISGLTHIVSGSVEIEVTATLIPEQEPGEE